MDLINFKEYPVKNVLSAILKDKTTKKNIIFATDAYSEYNVTSKTEMSPDLIRGLASFVIQPRGESYRQRLWYNNLVYYQPLMSPPKRDGIIT